jgi:sterol desaturase/sphingolipid hydroxylase (fatty acid hydroxylase superfamily)
MDQSLRVIVLGSWLLILWVAESIIPLRKNERGHLVTNLVFTISTVIINALLIYVLIAVINFCYANYVGLFVHVKMPIVLKAFIGLLVLDFFAAYLSHRTMHNHQLFWRYHQVHHLDEMVDVTTGLRQHPLETMHRFVFLIAGVVVLGAPLWIVVIYQTASAILALLEHSNIRLNRRFDRALCLIFITPNFHKVHHSTFEQHSNSNFGNIFSLWDRLFGTYKYVTDLPALRYGLPDQPRRNAIELFNLPLSRKKGGTTT